MPQARLLYLAVVVAVATLMAYALYTQYFVGLDPCPLCMTQRICYVFIAFWAIVAFLHYGDGIVQHIYTSLMIVGAIGGIAAAGRQVWLQHLPPEKVPACGPSLEYMFETFPLSKALKMLVTGDGNCAEVVWVFLGLSMGEWSLICFIGLLLISIILLLRRPAVIFADR